MYGLWNYMGSLHVQYRRWCIYTTNQVQCSGISKDMYRQNKWNNLEMETINIICCNSIKSPFWKCCEMDRHPHPRGMILRVILSQLRRLTLTELLELMQAIIETMNDRYANGCIGDTYDPSGYTDDSEASDDLEAMEPQAWYVLRSQPWCTYRESLLYVFADCKSTERRFGQKFNGLAATYVFADCVDWLALWPTTKKKQLARSRSTTAVGVNQVVKDLYVKNDMMKQIYVSWQLDIQRYVEHSRCQLDMQRYVEHSNELGHDTISLISGHEEHMNLRSLWWTYDSENHTGS